MPRAKDFALHRVIQGLKILLKNSKAAVWMAPTPLQMLLKTLRRPETSVAGPTSGIEHIAAFLREQLVLPALTSLYIVLGRMSFWSKHGN